MIMVRFFVLSALLFSFSAQAERMNIAPGLWQVKSHNPELEKAMANLPPEMRKMMDRGVQVCMTKEQIERGYTGQKHPDDSCKVVDIKQSAKQIVTKIHCSSPSATDITSTMNIVSKTKWTSVTNVVSSEGSITTKGSGVWQKADCGNVKPMP